MSSDMTGEKLNIVVPTRNRFLKLVEMMKTIPQYSWMELHLGFDGDRTSFERFSRMTGYWKGGVANLYFSQSQVGAIKMRNMMTTRCRGSVLWATDDITFIRGGIESAWSSLWREFPDGDGVVGFRQENAKPAGNFCWTGVGIMGEKFLDRYPKRIISFPGYFHFGTREIETLAVNLKKLYRDENALIFHNHPDFYPEQMDTTHMEARAFHEQDVELKKNRREQGLIWGDGDETNPTRRPDIS
jgi:hypothetical protein